MKSGFCARVVLSCALLAVVATSWARDWDVERLNTSDVKDWYLLGEQIERCGASSKFFTDNNLLKEPEQLKAIESQTQLFKASFFYLTMGLEKRYEIERHISPGVSSYEQYIVGRQAEIRAAHDTRMELMRSISADALFRAVESVCDKSIWGWVLAVSKSGVSDARKGKSAAPAKQFDRTDFRAEASASLASQPTSDSKPANVRFQLLCRFKLPGGGDRNLRVDVDRINNKVNGWPSATITDESITSNSADGSNLFIDRFSGNARFQTSSFGAVEGLCSKLEQRAF